MVFLKEIFEELILKKKQTTKKHETLPSRQKVLKIRKMYSADDFLSALEFSTRRKKNSEKKDINFYCAVSENIDELSRMHIIIMPHLN